MKLRSILGWLVCVWAAAAMAAEQPPARTASPRTLTFEDRVRAQEAIERVYYRHQIGTTKPFEEAVPRSVLEAKVRKSLEETAALQTYWKTPVTDLMLERELTRIASGTRMPERLTELYAALGNDAFLLKETLARATLVDRLVHNFYDFDPAMHAVERKKAEELHGKLESGELSASTARSDRSVVEIAIASGDPKMPRVEALRPEEFRKQRARFPSEVGRPSVVKETRDGYATNVVLGETKGEARIASYVLRKRSFESWWAGERPKTQSPQVEAVATSSGPPPTPRVWKPGATREPNGGFDDLWDNGNLEDGLMPLFAHTAVWTGSLMIVWGGTADSASADFHPLGWRYDPLTDTWSKTSTIGAPVGRGAATAVWTGSTMIIWGGYGADGLRLNSGGRYDPASDTWLSTSTTGAPSPRYLHTAVWANGRMVIWGGADEFHALGTGGRYDPVSDTWTPTSMTGAPSARSQHMAVWTGSLLVIWGGIGDDNSGTATGSRYDPVADTWMPTSTSGTPYPGDAAVAFWTGSRMLVWIGNNSAGGLYDPIADSWTSTSLTDAPGPRWAYSAVWTGHEMIVWGGNAGFGAMAPGARYDPVTDHWRPLTSVGEPERRAYHTAVWTGSQMIVWGGGAITGGRYDPFSDRWTPVNDEGLPAPRTDHTALWTGNAMIVWGGFLANGEKTASGSQYDPVIDSWRKVTEEAAPVARAYHSAVWTGEVMIVWSGEDQDGHNLATGGRYNPVTDTWSAVSPDGAPVGWTAGTAVWSGNEMLAWRLSVGANQNVNLGGRYDPQLDRWRPMSNVGAPVMRTNYAAIWTGSRMLIWGGLTLDGNFSSNTGGLYDPLTDQWTPMTMSGAPDRRFLFAYVWTGTEFVVWSGLNPITANYLADGGRYDPATDHWRPISASGPSPRIQSTAVWTGKYMVVWGGQAVQQFFRNGGRYDPSQDAWLGVSTDHAPSTRLQHTAVWTGAWMIVWGGRDTDSDSFPLTGGRYMLCGSLDNSDVDGDGFSPCGGDCDDGNPAVHPGAMEVCNGLDDDCDGTIDNGGAALCDDRNPCTADACDGANGCTHTMLPEGSECPDDESCTIDTCRSGQCVHTPRSGSCDDGNDCTGDDQCASGHCAGHPLTGTSCNDGDACTAPDTCLDGVCQAGTPVACDDHNVCNGLEECDPHRGCLPGTPLSCVDGDACNGVETCDPVRGCLPGTPLSCDDGNACNGLESCLPASGCRPGVPLSCHDSNPCTTDGCDPHTGCTFTPNSSSCDDQNPCTVNDNCSTGFCRGTSVDGMACDDGFICTTGDRCVGGACVGTMIDCDDHNVCTNDSCLSPSGCYHDPSPGLSCDDGNPCTADNCDPAVGCTFTPLVGVPCDDFFRCTTDDRCDASGSCVGHSVCDDGNPCSDDYADESSGCACTHYPSYEGTPCDDGSACTPEDACDGAGTCIGGLPLDCDDGNPCTDDWCDPATGCKHISTAEGTECDDGNACSTLDACDGAGHCLSVIPLECDDGNPCTDDSCNAATGCVHVNNVAPCNDGSACTTGDVCGGGTCHAGAPVICNDNKVCTDDTCNPGTGCVFTDNTAPCDDGNACTRTDVCSAGTCTGTNSVVCAALDQCHDAGVCSPSTGACSNPAKADGTACSDGSLCTTGDACVSGTCTPAFSGLNEPNPRSTGYYKRLCQGPHSGDLLTNDDAVCVSTVAHAFAGISTVAELCAELLPSQPNSDACDRTDDDLMALALNICRARVCTQQGIDSQCGSNTTVGQSLAESDSILSSASRSSTTCAQAKCLDEEINTGRGLEMNTLLLRREGGAVRLSWRTPYLEDGSGAPSKYHVWRRIRGSMAAFTRIATTVDTSYLDGTAGAFEYEVTAVMN